MVSSSTAPCEKKRAVLSFSSVAALIQGEEGERKGICGVKVWLREGKDALDPETSTGRSHRWVILGISHRGISPPYRKIRSTRQAMSPSYILSAVWGHLLGLESCSIIPKSKEVVVLLEQNGRVACGCRHQPQFPHRLNSAQ